MDKYDIKINDNFLNTISYKTTPPTFNEFLKTELECSPKLIETTNKRISSKKFNLEIKDCIKDKDIYNNFLKWKDIINTQNKNNCFDKVVIRKLNKSYPYKSKRKRHVMKWWKKHSELVELHNVIITPKISWRK